MPNALIWTKIHVNLMACPWNLHVEIFGKPLSLVYNLLAENKFTRENLSQLGSPFLNLKEVQIAWQKGGYPEPVLSASENSY